VAKKKRKPAADKAEVVYFEQIAGYLSKGVEPQQIQISTGLDLEFINRCIAHPDFDTIFAKIDPAAYEAWKESQLDLIAKRRVKTKAREDAPDYYDRLKLLVTTSEELRDVEKANLYKDLIKMSGVVDREEVVETTTLSPGQLDTIKEALREVG
jgi:hypothetical protein